MERSIEQRVIDVVAEYFGVKEEKVNRNARFREDLGADSLDPIDLVMLIEEEFSIEIPDDVAENFVNIGQVIDYVGSVPIDQPED